MYINFKNVHMENFQSILCEDIKLSNRGMVLVKGINSYDDCADSNGSGKSSIFESINWAIYGKTSSGITDPTNRYSNDGCMVKLDTDIDGQSYVIIRSIKNKKYKTSLTVLKVTEEEELDISGRNKTDTEKMIRNEIITMNQDIFLSTIFLSQGFSNRLSTLMPADRKKRIETLTETSEQLETFKDKITDIRNKYQSEYNDLSSKKYYNQGIYDRNISEKDRLKSMISSIDIEYTEDDITDAESDINNGIDIENSLNEQISDIKYKIHSLETNYNNAKRFIKDDKESIKSYEDKIKDLNEPDPICPVCNQKISKDIEKNISDEYNDKIKELKEEIDIMSNKMIRYKNDIDDCNDKMKHLSDELNNVRDAIKYNRDKLDKARNYISMSNIRSRINEYDKENKKIKDDINSIESELNDKNDMLSVSNHCLSLISKQFRGYMLEGVIKFMNNMLEQYSEMLFSHNEDIIKLSVDSSKLDIFLGDQQYNSLSGGEKRKIDLALVLTQRDLAINIAGSSSNILVLDEIFDNLDSQGISVVASMFSEVSSEIDSMFIISHKPDVDIPYDSIIRVVKGSDRLSRMENV